MADLVSIITPAFKAQSFIYRSVASVLAQSYVDWEMLIIADDELDYEQILKDRGIHDPRLRFFSTGKTQSGPNVARNIGLNAASGHWIAPLDADDIYYEDRLVCLLEAGQETGLALDNGYVVQEGAITNRQIIFSESESDRLHFSDFQKVQVPLLFLFHRGLILHGWDEDVARGADTLFNLRALEAAEYAKYVARPLHEYRVHNSSMCHQPNAAEHFDSAYLYTINKIESEGLGFRSLGFRKEVADYLREKKRINLLFDSAIRNGFKGNFQEFLSREST